MRQVSTALNAYKAQHEAALRAEAALTEENNILRAGLREIFHVVRPATSDRRRHARAMPMRRRSLALVYARRLAAPRAFFSHSVV